MNCEECKSNLGAWLDGETDRRLADAIECHTAVCATCNRSRQNAERLRGLLRQSPERPLPDGIADAVMHHILLPTPERDAAYRPLSWWRTLTPHYRIAAAAAICLSVGLGALMGESFIRNEQRSRPVASAEMADAAASIMQPIGETGAETLADVYMALTAGDEGRR